MKRKDDEIKQFFLKSFLWSILVFVVSMFIEVYILKIDEKISMFGSLVFSILTYLLEANRSLIEQLHDLWEMKARDVWGEPIGNSFANSDREAIKHEIIVKTFIAQFPDKPGKRGFLGHIFLHNEVLMGNYGQWLEGLVTQGSIAQYETINLFTPREIGTDMDSIRVVNILKDLPCKQKIRINVLTEEKLRKWRDIWNLTEGTDKNAHNFAVYINDEYEKFHSTYGGTGEASFKNYHVFDTELRARRLYLGEYVVINRRIAFKYDGDTQLFEFILGEEPIELYSSIFTHEDLNTMLPSDSDKNTRIRDIEDYLKKYKIY